MNPKRPEPVSDVYIQIVRKHHHPYETREWAIHNVPTELLDDLEESIDLLRDAAENDGLGENQGDDTSKVARPRI